MTDDTPKPGGSEAAPPRETADDVAAGIGGAATDESEASAASVTSTLAAVWQEGTPGYWVVKWGGLQGAPPEQAITLGRPGGNNHSPSTSADTSSAGRASGVSVVWIESPAGDASGVGAVMLQRLGAGAIRGLADPTALAATANDNATWVSDQSGTGAVGREPRVADLGTGDTLVAWIGVDDHVHGHLYAAVGAHETSPADGPEYAAVNATLDKLGPVGAAADGSRQLRVAELQPGTFAIMWLALAEGIPVLRGSLFLSSADTEQNDHPGGWTHHAIPEARLPFGIADPFTMSLAGEGEDADLQVTHSGPDGAITLNVLDHLGADIWRESHTAESSPPVGLTAVDGSGKSAAADAAPEQEAVTGLDAPSDQSQTPTWQSEDDGRPAQIVLAVATTPGVGESAPLVQTVGDGFAVAWQTPGSTDGAVQIRLALFDGSGVPRGPEVLVTDNAAADLAPAISSLSAGAAAAYVQADDRTLVIKAYAEDGAQIGPETVVNPGDTHAIVEIALGSIGEGELAVVYVQQDFDGGEGAADYGNIMLQRYAVAGEGDQSRLVELGRDGEHDGSDGAVQLTIEGYDPTTTERAVGRAPSVTRVHDGGLAIVWVESDGTRETIKGSLLDHGGEQALRIDLTGLIEGAGVVKGTKPALLETGDGDFLVSWLQSDGDGGGCVIMAAVYRETDPGVWLAPEQAVRLAAFDSEPRDYTVAVSADADGPFINVIWNEDNSGPGSRDTVYSQRYDFDGRTLGDATTIARDDTATREQSPAPSTLDAAGLPDGQIVVVYAQQGPGGDLDLAAQIIGTSAVQKTAASGGISDAIDAAGGTTFTTGVDQETAINPLADGIGSGLTIARINDVPITTATPVDVGFGWVQLREDGWLTVTPDVGYTGEIAFDYTVEGTANGPDSKGDVVVNVKANATPAAVTLLNQVIVVAEDISTAADLKVAEIAMRDGELGMDGLSLTGLDASMFKIVGNALYLKEGMELDFETKPTLSVEILASHADGGANFTLGIESASEAPAVVSTSDTFVFTAGFGETTGEHLLIDLSSTGYKTFQDLLGAGALVQVGDDVVITVSPDDPADLHRITLKGVELSVLSDSDFKFS